MTGIYTLIGDVVGSRRLDDRAGAQERIGAVLREVSPRVRPVQDLEATVGDEFQGAFATVARRRARRPAGPARPAARRWTSGAGWGTARSPSTTRSDGRCSRTAPAGGPPGRRSRSLSRPRRAAERTWYVGPDAGRVNAFLLTRDALVDRLGDRGHRLLAAALRGDSQADIAAAEGISRSAVSQQFARGVGAVRDAHRSFAETADETTDAEEDRP